MSDYPEADKFLSDLLDDRERVRIQIVKLREQEEHLTQHIEEMQRIIAESEMRKAPKEVVL